MKKSKVRSLTPDEQKSISRAVLIAAYEALGELPEIGKRDTSDISKKVVRSFIAAHKELSRQRKEACLLVGGYADVEIEADQAVASAYANWGTSLGDDVDINEMSPQSEAGAMFLDFAKAFCSVLSVSNALCSMVFEACTSEDGALAFSDMAKDDQPDAKQP